MDLRALTSRQALCCHARANHEPLPCITALSSLALWLCRQLTPTEARSAERQALKA